VIDDRSALVGSVAGDQVSGYWSGAGTLVAAARHALQSLSANLLATRDS